MDPLELDLRYQLLDVVTKLTMEHPEREMEIWGWFTAYCGEIVNPVTESEKPTIPTF